MTLKSLQTFQIGLGKTSFVLNKRSFVILHIDYIDKCRFLLTHHWWTYLSGIWHVFYFYSLVLSVSIYKINRSYWNIHYVFINTFEFFSTFIVYTKPFLEDSWCKNEREGEEKKFFTFNQRKEGHGFSVIPSGFIHPLDFIRPSSSPTRTFVPPPVGPPQFSN